MWRATKTVGVLVVVVVASVASADDLAGADRFLCAAVQATACVDEGECGIDLPWNLNIPDFIEVDLDAGVLRTTVASGENRSTPIQHLSRSDGVIVFHGYEMGRAFSWVVVEQTGRATVALAGDGASVAVFGSCTPVSAFRPAGG